MPRPVIAKYSPPAARGKPARSAIHPSTEPTQSAHPKSNVVTPPRKELERARIQAAADFCADSLSASWQDAVADRIANYAPTTWKRLKRSRRRCTALARLATSILEGKQKLHELLGRSAGWYAGLLGADDFAREFAAELATNIPLNLIDDKAVAVARGVQVSGILICVTNKVDITECQCFADLALAETKERVKQVLVTAMSDWPGLSQYPPSRTAIRH